MLNLEELLRRINLSWLAKSLSDTVFEGHKVGYQTGLSEAHMELKDMPPDIGAMGDISSRMVVLSLKTEERLVGNLNKSLMEGIKEREDIDSIRDRVSEVFEGMKGWETERVARTEIMRSTNNARESGWMQSNVVSYKMWWNGAVRSKRTAEDSKRMHGQIQEVGEPFTDPGTGKSHSMPPNRPNCRCTGIPLTELPKNIIYIAGMMYDAAHAQPEAKVYKGLDDRILDVEKKWTDEARRKALEARRRKMKSKEMEEYKKSLKNLNDNDLLKEVGEVWKPIDYATIPWFDSNLRGLDNIVTTSFGLSIENSRSSKLGDTSANINNVFKVYAANQEFLKRKYPSGKVTLYRGVGERGGDYSKFSLGQDIEVDSYNISSWSLDKSVGIQFVEGDFGQGLVVRAEIPIKNIFMQDENNGSDYPEEKEHIVMGGKIKGKIARVIK